MDFNPGEALSRQYGPLPGYAWLGIVAVAGFFFIKTRQNRAGTLNDPDGDSDKGEFSSTVRTKGEDGTETEYTASGPNSGFLGLVGQFSAGPMASSAGDVYVNLPGGGTATTTLQTYKVGTGETLHTIARKLFGSETFWRDLYRANASLIGEDPWRDLTGLVLQIPEGQTQPTDGVGFDIPKYADTSKEERHKLYDKYQKSQPAVLAKVLDKWSAENKSAGKTSLAKQQADWAAKLRG